MTSDEIRYTQMRSYEIIYEMIKLNHMITPSIQQLWDMISLCGYHLLNVKLNLNLNLNLKLESQLG